jgi:small subunit ribosomal protein S1
MDFKIIRMNEAERKIGLSLKAQADAEERGRLDEYQKRATAVSSGLSIRSTDT